MSPFSNWPIVDCLTLVSRRFAVAGGAWVVCEDPDASPPKFGPALVFYGPGTARRVREYPANWMELSDDELYAVSWHR